MKNPGLCAADGRARANSKRAALFGRGQCRRGQVLAASRWLLGRSGRVHRAHDLPHSGGVLPKEPKQALQVDHCAHPLVLQSHFHTPDVTRAPQPMPDQVGDFALHRRALAVCFLELRRGLLGPGGLQQRFVTPHLPVGAGVVTGDRPALGLALDAARKQRTGLTHRTWEMEAQHRPALWITGSVDCGWWRYGQRDRWRWERPDPE